MVRGLMMNALPIVEAIAIMKIDPVAVAVARRNLTILPVALGAKKPVIAIVVLKILRVAAAAIVGTSLIVRNKSTAARIMNYECLFTCRSHPCFKLLTLTIGSLF
jgi:hypothetical protein